MNVTSRAALVMLDLANNINHQKIPQSSIPSSRCMNTEQRAECSQKHSSEKSFTDGKWCLERKRSQAFESPLSARSDSLWWLWNIKVKKPQKDLREIPASAWFGHKQPSNHSSPQRCLLKLMHITYSRSIFLTCRSQILSSVFASWQYLNVIYVHRVAW